MGLRGEDESSYNEKKHKKVKRAMTCPSKEHHKRASIQWPLWHVALHRFANLYFLLSGHVLRLGPTREKAPNCACIGSTNEGSKLQMITKILND